MSRSIASDEVVAAEIVAAATLAQSAMSALIGTLQIPPGASDMTLKSSVDVTYDAIWKTYLEFRERLANDR